MTTSPRRSKKLFLGVLVSALLLTASAFAAEDAPNAAQPAVRDGSHDFDFIYGKWRMPNHRLLKRLTGSHDWADFISCDEAAPLAGGIGNIDTLRTNYWKDFAGTTVRTYDPATGLWRIYWVDNRFSHGDLGTPMVGKFEGNVGVFEDKEAFEGKPIIARFIWTINPKRSEAVANWEQAFSTDGGKTWETNWKNELIHDDHCDPG
jgi:hypothetical protein